jgi:ankyrin repeat protein
MRMLLKVLGGVLGATVLAAGVAAAGPLHDAARKGDLETVKQLIAGGTSVNDRDASGETALMAAALAGQTNMVERLITVFRADPMARNDRGMTPLHAAAMSGDLMSVEYVAFRGNADKDDQENKFGVTPLIVAAEENNGLAVVYLLSYGADIEKVERHGYSALTRAGYKGHDNIVAILLRAGAICQEIDPLWKADCLARKAALGIKR